MRAREHAGKQAVPLLDSCIEGKSFYMAVYFLPHHSVSQLTKLPYCLAVSSRHEVAHTITTSPDFSMNS